MPHNNGVCFVISIILRLGPTCEGAAYSNIPVSEMRSIMAFVLNETKAYLVPSAAVVNKVNFCLRVAARQQPEKVAAAHRRSERPELVLL